jgi:hypothetical protein
VSHDIDAQAERNEARHARALKALSLSDVLATKDDLVAQMLDARHHPVDELEAHGPRYGCGKRPYRSEMVGASYEPLIDEGVFCISPRNSPFQKCTSRVDGSVFL